MEPEQEKDAAAVRVFPPAIPLLTVLAGVGLNWLWPLELGFEFPAPQRFVERGPFRISRKFGETYLAYKRRVRRWL